MNSCKYYAILMITLHSVLICSCDEESVKPSCGGSFEGILEHDHACNIIGGDSTDFQPFPQIGKLSYSLVGACPNPVDFHTADIWWQLAQPDSVLILIYDRHGCPPIDTLFNRSGPEGVYNVQWARPKRGEIYRIKMITASGFSSYGDIQFLR